MNYKGAEKDIVLSVPTNTVEIKMSLIMYEDGELVKAEQILDIESIKECEQLFEDTVAGEYPIYVFTERGSMSSKNILINCLTYLPNCDIIYTETRKGR